MHTKLPDIVHPKRFEIGGLIFEIVSYCQLTDDQALKVATHFYRTHKFRKKDRGKLFQVLTTYSESSRGIL